MKLHLFAVLWLALSALTCRAERADSLLRASLQDMGIWQPYALGDDVRIYTNGTDKFEALFADIDAARRRVWVEYFIVANDSIGTLLMQHLAAAARRGCEVRLVIDSYKDRERHYGYDTPYQRIFWRAQGIDMVIFDPWRFPYVNHIARDHRKIVCIDDSIGYIGGLNVADYYIVGKPEIFGGWRDTHLRLTGDAVAGMMQLFHKQYVASGGEGSAEIATREVETGACAEALGARGDSVVYFVRSRESRAKKAETRRALVAAFDAARDTIRLVTPYMLPTRSVRRAMLRAIDRGVHVEILFSRTGDEPILTYGNYHLAHKFVKHGAQVFLYRGKFHHSKIIMVDGQFSMVGSANLNSRSLRWDYEASCFVFSADVTRRLDAVFEADKLECDTFTVPYYKERCSPAFRRKGWWTDRFLTPFF